MSVCPASFLPGFSDTFPSLSICLSVCCWGCLSASVSGGEACAQGRKACSGRGGLGRWWRTPGRAAPHCVLQPTHVSRQLSKCDLGVRWASRALLPAPLGSSHSWARAAGGLLSSSGSGRRFHGPRRRTCSGPVFLVSALRRLLREAWGQGEDGRAGEGSGRLVPGRKVPPSPGVGPKGQLSDHVAPEALCSPVLLQCGWGRLLLGGVLVRARLPLPLGPESLLCLGQQEVGSGGPYGDSQ